MMAIRKLGDATANTFTDEAKWCSGEGELQRLRRKFDVYSQFTNETVGGRFRQRFIADEVYRVLEPALTAVGKIKDHDVAKQALDMISDVADLVVNLHSNWSLDVSRTPSLHALVLEDDSFLIEWIFSKYRIGFVLEKRRQDSIWYLVSTIEDTSVERFGSLSKADNKKLVAQLVTFAFDHS